MTIKPELELVDIDAIIPYEGNAKKHPPEQISALAASIHKYGWTQPIIVDRDMVIIIGHGRRLAAKKLELKKVPVVIRRDLTKAQADALRLADNRVTSTDYDMKALQSELSRLIADGEADLNQFFTEKELTTFSDALSDIDMEAFVEDVGEAVEEQNAENEEKAKSVDDSAAPLADAMGFKRVTVEQSRVIRKFMVGLEEKHGKTGVDAFMAHIEETAE